MADRPSAPSPAGEELPAARPFDRSLLEATLADATRAVEAAAVTGAPAEEPPTPPQPLAPSGRPGAAVAPTRRPTARIPGAPASGGPVATPERAKEAPFGALRPPATRLVAPGAQALLSAAAPAPPVAPIEDRAVDAERLRLGAGPGLHAATTPPGGGVTLPAVGAGSPAQAPPVAQPAQPAGRPARPTPPAPAAPGRLRAPTAASAATERPAIRPWQPSDDDILPGHAARHRRRFRLR